MIKPKVLFLSPAIRAGRRWPSGFLRAMAGDRLDRMSAGSEETPIDPGPIFPGATWRLQWDLEDPSTAFTKEEHRAAVRQVRDDTQQREAFVEEQA